MRHQGTMRAQRLSTQTGLDQAPESMRIRRQPVEHPFGTIKLWMGSAHLLTRTLERVSTEMSLHVLIHNCTRVMKLPGARTRMRAMQA
jgi:transposase